MTRDEAPAVSLRGLLPLLDALRDGIVLHDAAGGVIHQNAVAAELLGREPEQARVREEIEVLSRSLALELRGAGADGEEVARAVRLVRTAKASYRLEGICRREGERGGEPATLIVLGQLRPEPLSDGELRERFRLTERELQVARRVAEGKPTEAVARELSISRHTVRRHVERLLAKLGAHSRAEIGFMLSAPCAPGRPGAR